MESADSYPRAVAYSQTLTASGGNAPYTWSIVGGTMPDGLNLSPDGVLSGTPTAKGSFRIWPQVTDSTVGITAPTMKEFRLDVLAPP